MWEMWKKGFDAWEGATAKYLETVLKSPLVLEPAGKMLNATLKAKVAQDEGWARLWGAVGIPTRRDQERLMHSLNQLQSKLIDLEDSLASEAGTQGRSPAEGSRERSRGARESSRRADRDNARSALKARPRGGLGAAGHQRGIGGSAPEEKRK